MKVKSPLLGKNILFISPEFFGYERIITARLIEEGATVDFYCEKPTNNALYKGLSRINFYLLNIYNYFYFKKILSKANDRKYDILFTIKGEPIPQFFVPKLKRILPKIFCIYYSWDSFSNVPKIRPLNILKNYNKVYSFDLLDCKNYNIEYRPLFCSDDFFVENNSYSFEYDLSFVGTAHSDRVFINNVISTQLEQSKHKYFSYLYFQSKLIFYLLKFLKLGFHGASKEQINFKPLPFDLLKKIFDQSKAILDIHHSKQSGLTMRVFEVLGSKKKLISTNEAIKSHAFYNPNNVLIIERNNPHIESDFLLSNYEDYDDEFYDKISINGFIEDIFYPNKDKAYQWIN